MQKVQKHATSASGTRTTRSTTKYYYDGTKLAAEKKDGTIVWYDYDENGAPIGMRVNGEDYLYRKNLQGDITGIYNPIGNLAVEYTYDAWGKLIDTTGFLSGTIGEYNSLRYRGYYYHSETGLYYLNSIFYEGDEIENHKYCFLLFCTYTFITVYGTKHYRREYKRE